MPTPRVKNPKNVNARELMGYDDTLVPETPGEPGPPEGPGEPPPVDLAFHAQGGWRRRLVAQPAAATEYFRASRPKFDASAFTHVRLVGQCRAAGAPTAYGFLEYSTDAATWLPAGASSINPTVSFADAVDGDIAGDGVPLADGAKADVWWRVRAAGGDGVESPEIARLSAQFFQYPTVATERWYWRPGTPGVIPTLDAYVGIVRTSDCTPEKIQTHFVTPLDEDVVANPQILSRTKGTGTQVSLDGATTSTPSDWYGPLGIFVGPAVRAQRVPPMIVMVTCGVQMASAQPDACYVHVRFGYYRESTEEVVAARETTNTDAWARFVHRAHYLPVPMPAVDLELGDRPFLQVWGSIASGCGGSGHTGGNPMWVWYGGNQDSFAEGQEMTGQNIAAYVDMARLSYVDYTP